MKTILIIDDEPNARAGLRSVIEEMGCDIIEASNGAEGIAAVNKYDVNLVLTDLRMPKTSGMTVLETLKKEQPDLPIVLITAYGSGLTAREALQKGAFDFISKPFDLETIELVIRRALKIVDLTDENKNLKASFQKSSEIDNIIGNSPKINRVFNIIRQVAPNKSNVLIEGESGTGKELIARAIHDLSGQANNVFVPVHCASFSESLLESELFGHEKGAFTGAIGQRCGRFEMANNGTLFLDEISTIPLPVQVKLLRVLQERKFERVGGNETIPANARIIAATNQSLEQLIKSNQFREDLFYRLNVVNIQVPPLRERPSDIKLLIDSFLKRFNKEMGKKIIIDKIAAEILEGYNWPGNVRELQNTVEALVVLNEGHEVTPRDLPPHILGPQNDTMVASLSDRNWPDLDNMTLNQVEKWLILRKLKSVKTRSEIAKQLGISRRNLYRRLNEYGVID